MVASVGVTADAPSSDVGCCLGDVPLGSRLKPYLEQVTYCMLHIRQVKIVATLGDLK